MIRRSILAATLFSSALVQAADPQAEFIQKWQAKGLSKAYIEQALGQAEKQPGIIKAISTPWEAKPWYKYRQLFLTQERLDAGLAFWRKHKATIERAEKELGVDAEIIVAIIGVETYYGRHMGRHKVLDALYTLGFHYPKRAAFFSDELGHFLQLAQEQQWRLDDIKGSYAGAMGYGQFIPSSYLAYSIDFDKDGKRDLLTNPVDAIGSVANYFAKHRWQYDQPAIIAPVKAKDGADLKAFKWDYKPFKYTQAQLAAAGIEAPKTQSDRFSLIHLETAEGKWEYYLAHPNFYSITRYNRSPLYAMAVWQFSQKLKEAFANE